MEELAFSLQSLDDMLRQRMIDRMMVEKQAEQIRQFNVGASERERAHNLEAERHKATQAESIRQHDIQRAGNIVNEAYPNDPADEDTMGLLKKTGYGGALRTVTQDPFEGVDVERMGGPDVTQKGFLRGGSKYLNSEQNRINAAKIAQDKQIAAAQEAENKRQFQEGQNNLFKMTAAQQAAIAGGNMDIKRLLAQSTIDTRNQKAQESADKAARGKAAIEDQAKRVIDTIDQLRTPEGHLKPSAQSVVGASRMIGGLSRFVPATEAKTAENTINQLKGQLIVDLLGEMKSQSRTGATGFGALNLQELKVLENSASKLDPNMSEADFEAELGRIYDRVGRVFKTQGAQPDQRTPEKPSSGFRVVGVRPK